MTTIAIIPARGGSKGLPGKNLRDLCGTPMYAWSIKAAKQSEYINRVIVSTEDQAIAEVAVKYGAEVHWRPAELAADNVHTVHVVIDYLNNCEKSGIIVERVAMLLATSPLRTTEDINGAFRAFEQGGCDSVISVVKYDKPLSCMRKVERDLMVPVVPVMYFETQRQDVKDYLVEVNGSIYISTPKHVMENISFHHGRVRPFEMDKTHSIDINRLEDFKIAEAIIWQRQCGI